MTAHDVPFLWCILQAALLSTLGVVAAWLFARKAPAAGATAAAAAAVMIAVVTLLIPVRVPKVELWTPSQSGNLVDAIAPAALNENLTVDESPSSGGVWFDVEDLAARLLTSMGAGGVAEQEFGPLIETCVVGLFAIGAAVGTLRFLWSLCFVARLCRDPKAIADGEASRLFTELKARLNVARTVELCESPRIASPAVVGWRRPVVLLPTERGDWTEDQLRATLAHELAHVVRGDFFWRFVAGATQAIHFFHPLVHWLTRRLTLMQELATDRLAASVAGGSANYLRALSELAIRLDDQSRLRAEPIVLPALSSNLMRRIVMLRSKDGSEAALNHRLASAVAVGLIALVGIGTMALRGNADAVESTAASGAAKTKLFARPPLNPAVLGQQDHGLFVIRPSELAKIPAFQPVYDGARKMLFEELQQYGGVDEKSLPMLDANAIDYIAGAPKLILRKSAGEGADADVVTTAIECEELIVRFHNKVDWEPWIDAFTSDVNVMKDGFTYYTLPTREWVGEEALKVAARDDRTLVFSTDVARLRHLAECDPNASSDFGVSWNSLDGGLATFMANATLDVGAELPEEHGARMATVILQNTNQFGAAFDVDATNQSQMRLSLTSPNAEAAKSVQIAFEGLTPLIIAQLRSMVENPATFAEEESDGYKRVQIVGDENTERNSREYLLSILADFKARLEPQADGTVQVRIEGGAVMPQNIMTAYKYEVAEGAPEEEPARR